MIIPTSLYCSTYNTLSVNIIAIYTFLTSDILYSTDKSHLHVYLNSPIKYTNPGNSLPQFNFNKPVESN